MKELLRPVSSADLEMILSWRNAPEVRKNMYTSHVISPDEHVNWWKKMQADKSARLFVLEEGGDPLGFVSFTKYTGPDGAVTWAFYSGSNSRRGIGSMMEQAALEFAFDELEVYRLECEVLSFNRPVVDFHVKHGFEIEGVSRNAYQREGERFSIYHLALTRDKWQRHVKSMFSLPGGPRSTLAGLVLRWSDLIDPSLVEEYSRVTGDDNPIHLDNTAAKESGFDRRISHGMLIGGLLSKYFANKFPGRGTIYLSQDLSFKSPVFVGEKVDHELRVNWHLGKKIGVSTITRVDDRVCVEAEAMLMLPPGTWSKERFI